MWYEGWVEGESARGAAWDSSLPADCIVLAIGYRSENSLYQELKDLDRPLYLLGDAGRVAYIHYAIWNAYEVARGI